MRSAGSRQLTPYGEASVDWEVVEGSSEEDGRPSSDGGAVSRLVVRFTVPVGTTAAGWWPLFATW